MRLVTYKGEELRALCVRDDQSVLEAMQIMSNAGLRLVPVLTAQSEDFAGVVADGDIRRFLSTGGQMDAPIRKATNHKPLTTDVSAPPAEIRTLMLRRGAEYLPVIEQGTLTALHVLWVTADGSNQTAVIMAGGLGSRLAPLTEKCPKPLLRIGTKPILTHIIESLRDQGVNQFVLSVNYLSEMIVDHYGDGSDLDVEISYVHEKARMGTGGALSLIEPEQLSDPFFCLNGDILNDINVDALRLQHQHNGWDATMVVRDYSYTVPYGVVNVGPDGGFEGAEEKPTTHYRINAGFYMLSKSILAAVPKGEYYDLPTLFTDLQKQGMSGGTYTHGGRWIDIGDIRELERARAIFEGPQE